jgi:hypothetical protein
VPESSLPRVAPSPSAYREKNPYNPPPPDYKAPSMLAQYRSLAILFALIAIGFILYCWKTPRAKPAGETPVAAHGAAPTSAGETPVAAPGAASSAPVQPVYIETIPEKDPR